MHIWVGSSFACYKCSCGEHLCPSPPGPKFSFLWDKCLGGEWPDHMEGVCSTFEKATKCFPECLNHFTLPSAEEEGPRGGWGLEPRLSPLQSLCPSLPGPRPPGPSVTADPAPPPTPQPGGFWAAGEGPTHSRGLGCHLTLPSRGLASLSSRELPSPAPHTLPSPAPLDGELGTQRVPGRCGWAQEAVGWTSLGSYLWLCEGAWGLPGPGQRLLGGVGTLRVSLGSLPSW